MTNKFLAGLMALAFCFITALPANALSNEMRGWIQEQKLPPAEQKRLEAETDESAQRILTRLRAEIPKRISFGELVEKVGVETYDKYYTVAEVKDLIAF